MKRSRKMRHEPLRQGQSSIATLRKPCTRHGLNHVYILVAHRHADSVGDAVFVLGAIVEE